MKTLRLKIPSGDAGADVTARALRQLIEHGKRDPLVRQTAISILKTKDVAPHDKWGEVRALHGWVQRNVRYVKDPYQIEYVQTPGVMLTTMTGDCDDYTAFLGALLESVGYPVDIKIVARSGRPAFHHVYPTVNLDGMEVGLDASMPVPFGFQSSDLRKQRVYRSELNSMNVSDVYGGLGALTVVGPTVKGGISSQILSLIDRYVEQMKATGNLCLMSESQFVNEFQRTGGSALSLLPQTVKTAVFALLRERFAVEKAKCRAVDPVLDVDPVVGPTVGACAGIRWPDVLLSAGQKLTERCVRERIASGKIRAGSGCELQVMRTVDPGILTVVSIPVRPDIAQPPPPDVMPPLPAGVAHCPWPVGKSVQTLQSGESIRGHCVKKFADQGFYRPAAGCKLVYQGPDDPTRLPGPEGVLTCVAVGYDQPPDTYVPPPDGYVQPDGVAPEVVPYIPGAAPTIVTVPSAVPAFKEAGFPTWAIIAIGAAVLLPMLMGRK